MVDSRAAEARPPQASPLCLPFAHNAHVLQGFEQASFVAPDGGARTSQIVCAHGSYVVRLEDVTGELAEPFLRAVGVVGGGVHTDPRESGLNLVLFLSLEQVEALRSRLLAAPTGLPELAEEVVAALRAYHRTEFELRAGPHSVRCGVRPLIMGVVNCTPDSFFGGSQVHGKAAVAVGEQMVAAGADLLDVGGESTRPDSDPIAESEELERVIPVIRDLSHRVDLPIAVDTTKAAVAQAAVDSGATLVNDISGLSFDPEMAVVVAKTRVPIILMHTRGRPREMRQRAHYEDVVSDVIRELRLAMTRATDAGIAPESILVDPGIGFAKNAEHSLIILRHLTAFRSLGRPLVVGPSRKSFIGSVLDLPTDQRLEGTAAAVAIAVMGGAHVLRVHDVEAMGRVAAVAAAVRSEGVGWIS